MFKKYASNILLDLYADCLLRSLSCKNDDDSNLYSNIAKKINVLISKLK